MKTTLVLCLVAFALATETLTQLRQRQFEEFIVKYNKSYESSAEKERRFRIFQANVAIAEQRTLRDKMATFGVTKFSDLTTQEFKDKYLMKVERTFVKAPIANITYKQLPAEFDWNDKGGVVTPVKNQGQCGSCWDFSATETIESVWAQAGNGLQVLSEQQTVDCDTTDQGCNGGWPYDAYQYIISAGGVESEASYPYTAEDGTCNFNAQNVVAKISSWQYVTQSQDETAMQQFLYQNNPISICVDASTWSSYNGGVITPSSGCGDSIDHCVQATGWSQQSGVTVWNVRNSWGTDWGNSGYIWVQMGSDVCGIAEVVTSPSV